MKNFHVKCFFALAIFIFSQIQVSAEVFQISLKGNGLKKLAAVEIALEFDPLDSMVLSNYCFTNHGDWLFKSVDSNSSTITLFFAHPLNYHELQITGSAERANFSGKPNIKIKNINYIPGFGLDLDSKSITSKIQLLKDEDVLQYTGITKAEILGPQERIFNNRFPVIISNIETYGFEFNHSIKNVWINGQKAFFVNEKIVASNLELEEMPYEGELEITLEVEVRQQIVKKTIGKIKLIE